MASTSEQTASGTVHLVRVRHFISVHRVEVALATLALVVVGPVVATLTAQGAARYLLTAAIVEQGTVVLDDYEPVLGVDRAEVDGHIYSDKAPGQPYLGVPVLWVAQAVGVDEASELRVESDLGLWSQTFVFCTIPAAVLTVILFRHSRRSGASTSISAMTSLRWSARHSSCHWLATCTATSSLAPWPLPPGT